MTMLHPLYLDQNIPASHHFISKNKYNLRFQEINKT